MPREVSATLHSPLVAHYSGESRSGSADTVDPATAQADSEIGSPKVAPLGAHMVVEYFGVRLTVCGRAAAALRMAAGEGHAATGPVHDVWAETDEAGAAVDVGTVIVRQADRSELARGHDAAVEHAGDQLALADTVVVAPDEAGFLAPSCPEVGRLDHAARNGSSAEAASVDRSASRPVDCRPNCCQ